MDDIYNRFRNYVLSNGLITSGDKILLSLSAGKDSMFMLHLMEKLQNEIDYATGIFHLNHLTRGEETDKDEFFIRERSLQNGIPIHIERFDFKKNKLNGVSFEEQARDVRYSFLKKICEAEGYTKIATAHNMNDNAETVLMRILSGTGIAGIRGILPSVKNIIRPVLFAEKNEIYSYLKNNNLEWREDLSNNDNLYLRNYIRNRVMPAAASRFPRAEENLNHLSGHAVENYSLLCSLADRLYPDAVVKSGYSFLIDVNDFHEDIPLIKLFISRILYDNYGIKMKASIHNEIIRRYKINSANMVLYKKESFIIKKILLNSRIMISINDKIETQEETENWEYHLALDDHNIIYLNEINKKLEFFNADYDFYISNKERPDMVFIQPENDLNEVIIRNRRPGDRIRIETGTKKIKELMIEKKLDTGVKNSIPLIVVAHHIAAYLPGLVNSNNNRVACNFHISNDTKRILAFFFRDC